MWQQVRTACLTGFLFLSLSTCPSYLHAFLPRLPSLFPELPSRSHLLHPLPPHPRPLPPLRPPRRQLVTVAWAMGALKLGSLITERLWGAMEAALLSQEASFNFSSTPLFLFGAARMQLVPSGAPLPPPPLLPLLPPARLLGVVPRCFLLRVGAPPSTNVCLPMPTPHTPLAPAAVAAFLLLLLQRMCCACC